MAYVKIPREINQIKDRFLGNFTLRQIVLIGCGLVLSSVSYFSIMKLTKSSTAAALISFLILSPFVAVCQYNKNGMMLEKVIKNIVSFEKKPKIRTYQTTNTYELLQKQSDIEEEMKNLLSHAKKNHVQKAAYNRFMKQQLKEISNRQRISQSVQDSIPFIEMYRDGVCKVKDDYFTKTLSFGDTNYQLAHDDIRCAIFDGYCRLHNSFNENVSVQITCVNRAANFNEFEDYIKFSSGSDEPFEDLRQEYLNILNTQLEKGTNLVREKYITYGVKSSSRKKAKLKLEQIESSIEHCFSQIKVNTFSQNGYERLKTLHDIFHIRERRNFVFDWNLKTETGLSTKDFIAPDSFSFQKNSFQMGSTCGAVFLFKIEASELSDELLSDFLNINNNLIFNIHFKTINSAASKKVLKNKIANLGAKKIREQTIASQRGYDIDILPADLKSFEKDTETFLNSIQENNEKMIIATITVAVFERNAKKLSKLSDEILSLAREHTCELWNMDYLQENGLMSVLPLGLNNVPITRTLSTSSTAVFIPFISTEIFQPQGIYYGINSQTKNIILADRKKLKNPNGLYLGIPGSGKTFAAKREITDTLLTTNDDVIINDPEGEYRAFTLAFNGQVVDISSGSGQYINPMDIDLDYTEEGDPISFKADFILSLMELIMGGKYGLSANERTVIDRCARKCYEEYSLDPVPENMPILEDLYNLLKNSPEKEAHDAATALELYVSGSLNIFNHQTNVDINNRFLTFDIKKLGKQMKKIAMLIIQYSVWSRVSANRSKKKFTWFYQDEFHLLFNDELTAQFSVEIFKRFRKWGGIPTGITQNVNELLKSKEIGNIFDNAPFLYLLQLAASDQKIVAELRNLSSQQLEYLDGEAEDTVGESVSNDYAQGLLCFGKAVVPFYDKFPNDTKLYGLMTSKLEEAIV